jgi:hypothetical protein
MDFIVGNACERCFSNNNSNVSNCSIEITRTQNFRRILKPKSSLKNSTKEKIYFLKY